VTHLARLLVVLAALGCSIDAGLALQPAGRLIAIADVHGAYDEFVRILTKTGLIDADRKWAGGRTTFVQTGDYTDRGARVRDVMDLLMSLEEGAKAAGADARVLLGNHEVMNIIGDMRYVTPEIAAAFADDKSEAKREQAWKQYTSLVNARAQARPTLSGVYRQTREAWMAAHPPGWIEYREALSAKGKYGRWLRSKVIAASVGGTIFMHAGINPDRPTTVDDVNTRARTQMARYETFLQKLGDARLALPFFTLQEVMDVSNSELEAVATTMEAAKVKGVAPDLSGFDIPLVREALEITKMSEWLLLSGEEGLWFRGWANWPEDEATTAKVNTFLTRAGVARIAVGHTPTKDSRINMRFGGRVFVMDTGMLASMFKGRPSALEIRGQQVSAIYEDDTIPLFPIARQ
jgi:hypothetical protein